MCRLSHPALPLVAFLGLCGLAQPAVADEQALAFDQNRLRITSIAYLADPAPTQDVSIGQPIAFTAQEATAKFKNLDAGAGHAWELGYEMNLAVQSFSPADSYIPPVNPFMLSLDPLEERTYAKASELDTFWDVVSETDTYYCFTWAWWQDDDLNPVQASDYHQTQ